VLSFSFEVHVRQGRVTLPCKSLPGVRAPNRSAGECREVVGSLGMLRVGNRNREESGGELRVLQGSRGDCVRVDESTVKYKGVE